MEWRESKIVHDDEPIQLADEEVCKAFHAVTLNEELGCYEMVFFGTWLSCHYADLAVLVSK